MAVALGVDRAGYLNWLADEGGHHTAQAAIPHAHMSLHLTGPNGVYAWFQLLWPQVEVAMANNFGVNRLAYHESVTLGKHFQANNATDDREWFASSQAPWIDSNGNPYPGMEVTMYQAGRDETHTQFPTTAAIISGKADLLAGAAAIQVQESSALLPVIGVDPVLYGSAPGAPDAASVPSADGLVELFNSAASRFTLSNETDQQIYETYYKAFVGLNRAAPRSTVKPHLDVTKNAARVIGLNFAAELAPTPTDMANFGINAFGNMNVDDANFTRNQKRGLTEWGKMMIVTAKAMALGLTNSGIIALAPGPTSDTTWVDPHETFNNNTRLTQATNTTRVCGEILEGFYQYLNAEDDPVNAGKQLIDNVVITAHGDTPHTPLQGSGWPDQTPDGCNWIYVVGKGYLKYGWFGRVHTTPVNGFRTSGFDGTTGDNVPGKASSATSTVAGGAIAYAIAKGDSNFVSSSLGSPLGNYEALIRDA